MDERLSNLRSTKNPKARIKIMSGHFATRHSHVNTYIEYVHGKDPSQQCTGDGQDAGGRIHDEYFDRHDCLPQEYRSDRRFYGGGFVGQRACIPERRQ